jgi:hypothetical protein
MSADDREAGRELARRAAERQGLAAAVDDVVVLRRVAALAGIRRPQRESGRAARLVGGDGG